MSAINERFKMIRKNAGMTQEEFGLSLGLSRVSIAKIEAGTAELTERTSKAVCLAYRVDECWLKTGAGEMYVTRSKINQINDFVEDATFDRDKFKIDFLLSLSKLDKEDWIVLNKICDTLIESYKQK